MDHAAFFAEYRKQFGALAQEKVVALEFLLSKLESDPFPTLPQAAYALATVKHETADTYLPVKEAYFMKNAEEWRRRNLRYHPFFGRGYVQITWKANYQKAGEKLGMDLVTDPDVVMRPEVSYAIMLRGMTEGWFTGKKLSDFINSTRTDYRGARRVINGTDKASLIAGYATKLEGTLKAAGYAV